MATETNHKLSFEEWMKCVDHYINRFLGMSHDDLPDIAYHDLYDDGSSARAAAVAAVKAAQD